MVNMLAFVKKLLMLLYSLLCCSYQVHVFIMDTFPAMVTKHKKVSEVAMVNCAYQCPYAYYGYPCYCGYQLNPIPVFVMVTKLIILVGM